MAEIGGAIRGCDLARHAFSMMDWDPDFSRRSAMFEPLRGCAFAEVGGGWPDLAQLQRLIDRRVPPVCNSAGNPLRLVPHRRRSRAFEDKYEARIFLSAELQMRTGNWHDLLNLLVWISFPHAKAALNARHYTALRAQAAAGAANRGPVQDALTLFDEGGVIVASTDQELTGYLREWRWKELFWIHRARLRACMRFCLFGHALYEKALQPFVGITGRGIVLSIEPQLLALPFGEQIAVLDRLATEYIADARRFASTRELAVVPILGVPGWCAANEREAYYENQDYFRPARGGMAGDE